ncbi:hypothetical protein A2U01_0060046, partial [Trifolium medium]|nr:hypothetical protein [Trifolium medium]
AWVRRAPKAVTNRSHAMPIAPRAKGSCAPRPVQQCTALLVF